MIGARAWPFALLPILTAALSAQAVPDDAKQREQRDIDEAIVRLGSADPAEREAASRTLWTIGEPAEDALRETAEGDDVEAARRASEILRHIRYGIRPDTPKVILDLLAQY